MHHIRERKHSSIFHTYWTQNQNTSKLIRINVLQHREKVFFFRVKLMLQVMCDLLIRWHYERCHRIRLLAEMHCSQIPKSKNECEQCCLLFSQMNFKESEMTANPTEAVIICNEWSKKKTTTTTWNHFIQINATKILFNFCCCCCCFLLQTKTFKCHWVVVVVFCADGYIETMKFA